MDFYVLQADHSAAGPYAACEMMQMLQTGIICDETPAAAAGDSVWRPLTDLIPLLRYEAGETLPAVPAADIEAQIAAARQSGPPTPPVLARLLREEESFPRPRGKVRPPPPIILNPAVRRIPLPRPE